MPWKVDDNGAMVLDNGNPVFIMDGGEERLVDFPAMSTALSKANREAAERKGQLRAAEEAARAWEGIEDIPAFIATARRDADTVKAMGDKEKSAEETFQARLSAATSPLEKKIAEMEANHARVTAQYHEAIIRSQFGTSKYVNEELVNPALVQELFAKRFTVNDNGELVGHDSAGKDIYDENGIAGFDYALRHMVNESPYKGNIVKGSTQSGSGANPGVQNGGGGGAKTMKRADFDMLPPFERAARMKEGFKLTE